MGEQARDFDRPVTVGTIYMLKLNHLVEDKIHARSTVLTVWLHPLGGKAQLGGQDLEKWKFAEKHGLLLLQEILTVKSDDVAGRTKVYETIVKGNNNFNQGFQVCNVS